MQILRRQQKQTKANWKIQVVQVRLLFLQNWAGLLASLGVASVMTLILWGTTDHYWLILWFSAYLVITSIRILFLACYHKCRPVDAKLPLWLNLTMVGALFSGLSWGGAAMLFAVTPSAPHRLFIMMTISGVLMGGLGSLIPVFRVYIIFMLATLLPLVAEQIWLGHITNYGFAAVGVLYGITLYINARSYHATLIESLTIRNENLELVRTLAERNAELTRSSESSEALYRILEMSLEGGTLNNRLDRALEIICSVKWINLDSTCAIFLCDEDKQQLVLRASRHFPATDRERCIPKQELLFGGTSQSQIMEYLEREHTQAQILFRDVNQRACYKVPIRSASQVLGLMLVYLEDGHKRDRREMDFLNAASTMLAGIIERCRADEEMKLAASVYENSLQAIMILDSQIEIVKVNPEFVVVTGYAQEDVQGKHPDLLRSRQHGNDLPDDIWSDVAKNGSWHGEVWNRRSDGEVIPVWESITAIYDSDNRLTNYISIFYDISEQKRNEAFIRNLAYHDALTDLPNRYVFEDRVQHALERAHSSNGRIAVLFLDLQRFKTVNSSYGYPVGDKLLQQCARRILAIKHEADTLARIGGDEFGMLLENLVTPMDAENAARSILAALSTPLKIDDHEIIPAAVIGIGIYPDDGADVKTLLKNVDIALDNAEKGGSTYVFYSHEMARQVVERVQMENALRSAIEQNELVLHYQPQFSLKHGSLVGMEALLRWTHPKLGNISPTKFIPLAEDCGMIAAISEWVLKTAMYTWVNLEREYGTMPRLCVNLSGHDIAKQSIAHTIAELLQETCLQPGLLEVEITETALVADVNAAVKILHELKALGIKVAIDDFGTGYSSLSYLAGFPIDTVKIDRSFIHKFITDTGDSSLVRAILQMCRSLDLSVVAEGVETIPQYALLHEMHCDVVQGYLTSSPLNLDEVRCLLKARSRGNSAMSKIA